MYRGVPEHPDNVNLANMGTHWTPNLETAKSFADNHGTVIEGRVNPSEVVTPHTEEWYGMGGIRPGSEEDKLIEAGLGHYNTHAIFDPSHFEGEVTVRPKGLVHINRLHNFETGIASSKSVNATGGA